MHGKEIAEMVMMRAAVMGETCRKKKGRKESKLQRKGKVTRLVMGKAIE